ncbi:ABC transporter family substrate-binding protein [Streptomyces sp. 4N509B]|uniref:ABC transporter family substrate-binding protein n=1 Tax=Streptomyces sp. 4N509B TaxID=3457413 RepID=UPI003FD57BB1
MPGTTRRRCRLSVTVLAVAVSTLLAGCSGGGTEGPGTPTAATHAVALVPRAELRSGGSVTWAVDELPASLNVYHHDAGQLSQHVAQAVMPMLFTLDPEGEPAPNPDYLRSAEVTTREPRQTVVYTLRPSARWSDGEPVDAADFRAQWRALRGDDPAYAAARAAGYDRVESVTQGPGKHQVTVVFSRPYADWRSLFSPLYPEALTADPELFTEGVAPGAGSSPSSPPSSSPSSPLPSAGAFAVAAVDREAGTVTLARDEAWWGQPALLDELVFAAVPRERREEALLAGELDVAEVTPAVAARLAATADGEVSPGQSRPRRALTVHRAYDAAYTQLTLNGSTPALGDERVRWALARALDRDALAEAVHAPAGLVARPVGSHLRTLGHAGYEDTSDALGDSSEGASTALLEEAGWRYADHVGTVDDNAAPARRGAGETVRLKDGDPLQLRLLHPTGPGSEHLSTTARNIADTLAGVGVLVEVREVPSEEFFSQRVPAGDFDLALYSWPATSFPATDALPRFAKPQGALATGAPTGVAAGLTTGSNHARLGTDHIDQLLTQAGSELDDELRDELLTTADARLWALAGSVPLYQPPQLVAAPATLAGVGAHGLATPRYEDIGHRR